MPVLGRRQLRSYPGRVAPLLRRFASSTPRPSALLETDVEKPASSERHFVQARRPLFAVLVDAENARYSVLALILEEIARMGGDPSIRRVYGDFSKPCLAPWRQVSLDLSFRTVNAFSYISGKGSTDAALIIDAMDSFYKYPQIEGFALVSSDSDFTPLAQRLREAGKRVIGFGERHTPQPFVRACERYVYTDNLTGFDGADAPDKAVGARSSSTAGKGVAPEQRTLDEATLQLLRKAINDVASEEDGWSHLCNVAPLIYGLQPDFDVRSFGYSKSQGLKALIGAPALSDRFEVKQRGSATIVRCRADSSPSASPLTNSS